MADRSSKDRTTDHAEQFIDEIMKINRKYGFVGEVSRRERARAVAQVAKSSQRLNQRGNARG